MEDRYLFRGKRLEQNMKGEHTWQMGHYVSCQDVVGHEIYCYRTGRVYQVDPATIGQCTGIKDKHGRLISEGDLLKWSEDGDSETGKVLWKTGGWAILFGEHVNFMESEPLDAGTGERIGWEIIGNIHDNPELMKEV